MKEKENDPSNVKMMYIYEKAYLSYKDSKYFQFHIYI